MTKFIHIRYTSLLDASPEPHGGLTIAYNFDPERRVAKFYIAKCNDHEHYNKKIGRQVAEGRLVKKGYGEEITIPEGQSVAATIVQYHLTGEVQ